MLIDEEVKKELENFLTESSKKLGELDYFNKFVEFSNLPASSVTAQSSFLLATVPSLKGLYSGLLNTGISIKEFMLPIGGAIQFSLSETNNLTPMGEIGSVLMRMGGYGADYQFNIGRLITIHSNLKYSLYRWFNKLLTSKLGNRSVLVSLPPAPQATKTSQNSINQAKQYVGLHSDIFRLTFGLIQVKCDATGKYVGADFLEDCIIMNYGSSISADNPMIMDNVSGICSIVRPLSNPITNEKIENIGSNGSISNRKFYQFLSED